MENVIAQIVCGYLSDFFGIWAVPVGSRESTDLNLRFSRFQHAEDLAESQFDAGVLRVTILSSRGIGRCTITPEEKNWPERVEIFFPGLTELESLQWNRAGFLLRAVAGNRDNSVCAVSSGTCHCNHKGRR